ncbi:helix-turn-helix domain-containing protein [Pseudorhodoferax sp. Leaf267]|uniref:helix-turn-helix domain-containing protein n=1 Tax=Pseudorhodoferax sp. Leaf267 TaxID=1736316 RepID=UPI0006F9CAD0|nr:helix-turn-helix domain-containing protein [Pseudorhodoferax sp. Leaf267]KQP17845.1 CdaR family transcriptional regulator [Pseudorhodoferax sp. Leaf267]
METAPDTGQAQGNVGELIALLHQDAAAEDFAAELARIERLPSSTHKTAMVERTRMAMAVRNRLDSLQQRERGMLAVVESARDLSGRLDLHELLQAIVSRARRLLGSHVAWLSAYDAALDAFHVRAADGALLPNTGEMVAAREHGIVSMVVATRLPFTTPDYLHDARFAHDAKLDATFQAEGIAAVVGVPLLWGDEVIGLLFVADRYQRTYTALSISILSTLATHAAVAMKNAMAFEQAQAAVRNAERARAELELHVRQVQAAAEAHERLTTLLARGATLAELAQAAAELMQGDLLVLDEAGQPIARGTAAGRAAAEGDAYAPHGPRSLALGEALGRSRQTGRSVIAYEAGGLACRLNAVIGGSAVLGAVLLYRSEPLDEMSVRTFERSTGIVGIVLLSHERMEAARSHDLSELLRALVSPRQMDLALLSERAARFGLDLARPTSLVLLALAPHEAGYIVRRLRAGNLLPDAVFDENEGVVSLLCATTRLDEARRVLVELARAGAGTAFCGVASRPIASPAGLPALHAALRRALPVLQRIGVQGQVLAQNELALYSALFETHDQASLGAFLDATIGTLLAHDRRRGTDLAGTLLCYFDHNQNATLVAQRLGIHVNTVRQRLASIEELVGHWGSATRALELHIALRLWHLRDAPRGDGAAAAAATG